MDCPPTVPQYCCCTPFRPPYTTVFEPSSFAIVICNQTQQTHHKQTSRSTHREQRARACAPTVAHDRDLLRVEERLSWGVLGEVERLALVTELLGECILAAVDHLLDRRLQPVGPSGEGRVVRVSPVDRVVEELAFGICAGDDVLDDELRERGVARLSVKTGLRLSCRLGACDLREFMRRVTCLCDARH